MLSLTNVMLGTMQLDAMVKFYKEVFQKPEDMTDEKGGFHGWMVGNAFFSVGEHSEMGGMAKDPGRVMFNFDAEDVKGEYDRIMAIDGAKSIKAPYEMGGMWIATLADPDGNFFQLMTPWKAE